MILAFCSALQRRRRAVPVNTSIRDAAGIISTSSPVIISSLKPNRAKGRASSAIRSDLNRWEMGSAYDDIGEDLSLDVAFVLVRRLTV